LAFIFIFRGLIQVNFDFDFDFAFAKTIWLDFVAL